MKLVKETNAILKQKCELFDFNEPIIDPYELSDGLQKIRKEGGGIGLAAPQVGLNTQALVIGMGNFTTEGSEKFDQVFFNPTIKSYGGEESYMIEGCLSYPNLFVEVKRPAKIVLEWYTEEGTECDQEFDDMVSRILQHEVDHLNGISFINRANSFHLKRSYKKRMINERRKKQQNNA